MPWGCPLRVESGRAADDVSASPLRTTATRDRSVNACLCYGRLILLGRRGSGSNVDSLILTATPSRSPQGSVRTMSPRQTRPTLPEGLRICSAKVMRFPAENAPPCTQKNTPDLLTSRVTAVVFSRITGSAVRTRASRLFSSCEILNPR